MSFINRLSNGWKLSLQSFTILNKNRSLLIFPILSGISLILILGTFFTGSLIFSNFNLDNLENSSSVLIYGVLFLYYVFNYFVIVFFNMALTHCCHIYFNGEKPTIKAGLQFSLSKINIIFQWAVLAATVGTILKLIQENSGLIGKIITGILGLVWGIATFFIVPVIAYENLGPIDAFKQSSQLMKEKWGESLGATFSFGIIHLLAFLLLVIPLFFIGSLISLFIGILLAALGSILLTIILSAAQTVFVSATYHHIKNQPLKDFDGVTLDQIFIKK